MRLHRVILIIFLSLVTFSACVFPGAGTAPSTVVVVDIPQATSSLPPDPAIATIQPVPAEPTFTLSPFDPLVVRSTDCSYGGVVKAIEALDQFTVRFEFCQPQIAFLSKIAFPSFGIQPRAWLEQTGGGHPGSKLLENPIGTGPYRLVSWEPEEAIILQAFDKYWSPHKPALPNLVFRWESDEGLRLLDLQAGAVNGIDNLSSIDYEAVQSDLSLQFFLRAPLSVVYLGMNNLSAPFDNEKIRQAVAMAIDRQQLIEEYFMPGYEVADYFTPCLLPNACVGEPWYDYDPARARELLAEAGYPNGFETHLTYRDASRGYLPQPILVAEAIRTQLRRNLGITVLTHLMDTQPFYEALDAGSLEGMYLLGWGADYPDVSNFLDTHFGDQASLQFGNKFSDILDVLRAAAAKDNPLARRPDYEAANNALRQHAPFVPLAHGGWISPHSRAVAYQAAVQGGHASPFSLEDFSALSITGVDTFTWMQEYAPLTLYCADETDIEALRICAQVTEPLYRFVAGGIDPQPALAEYCVPEAGKTVWTCSLRQGVLFHNGSTLDANDVVFSLWVQWDAAHPLHNGRNDIFAYWKSYWGAFLNQE